MKEAKKDIGGKRRIFSLFMQLCLAGAAHLCNPALWSWDGLGPGEISVYILTIQPPASLKEWLFLSGNTPPPFRKEGSKEGYRGETANFFLVYAVMFGRRCPSL